MERAVVIAQLFMVIQVERQEMEVLLGAHLHSPLQAHVWRKRCTAAVRKSTTVPLLALASVPTRATPPRNAACPSKPLVVVSTAIVRLGPILGKKPILTRRMGMF